MMSGRQIVNLRLNKMEPETLPEGSWGGGGGGGGGDRVPGSLDLPLNTAYPKVSTNSSPSKKTV